MKEAILEFFQQYPNLAIIISLAASVLVAVIGVLPSFFITAANIVFFGFWQGIIISFLGEALGAALAFWLYRKGFKKGVQHRLEKYHLVKKLLEAENVPAAWLVLALRLIPFVPSGLVTFTAAIGRISFLYFILASTMGKLPALLLEGYAVYQVTEFGWQGKLILSLIAIFILYLIIRKLKFSHLNK